MKQDRQQELHFEDLAKQFTENVSRSKRGFSMEDAMQDNTMRKSVQKHRRKMKRKTVLEYAIAFSVQNIEEEAEEEQKSAASVNRLHYLARNSASIAEQQEKLKKQAFALCRA